MEKEEGKNALLDAIDKSLEVEDSIKVKDDKKVELEGKITAENAKLAAEKKAGKTKMEGCCCCIEVEVEVSIPSLIKVKDDKKFELEGKITAENAKLAVEKKEEKTGIEGGAICNTKDEGKDNPEVKYEDIEQFSEIDQPLKETASRDRYASNQLAEAEVEREDKLKAEEKQN